MCSETFTAPSLKQCIIIRLGDASELMTVSVIRRQTETQYWKGQGPIYLEICKEDDDDIAEARAGGTDLGDVRDMIVVKGSK